MGDIRDRVSDDRSDHSEGCSVEAGGEPADVIGIRPGRVLRVDALAQLFGKSEETIMRWLRKGEKLHGFKLERNWYVREADLERDLLRAVQSQSHLRRDQEDI